MSLEWEGEAEDRDAARAAAVEHDEFLAGAEGEAIVIANEFSEIRVMKVPPATVHVS